MEKRKYLLKNGSVRVTGVRPSMPIRRSFFDVDLARLKMHKASLQLNGLIVINSSVFHGEDARKEMCRRLHVDIQSRATLPAWEKASREARFAQERCAIAYKNRFQKGTKWCTLLKQATVAVELVNECDGELRLKGRNHPSPRDSYVTEFIRIIKRVGISRFETLISAVEQGYI
jgi:hypothetical protein